MLVKKKLTKEGIERVRKMISTVLKKMVCFVPGVGTPASLYYAFTSKELRSTALQGLLLIPASVITLGSSSMLDIPLTLRWLASVYIYWGILAVAGGWGFLVMLMAWHALEKIPAMIEREAAPEPEKISELIPPASVSEVIPDMDANSLLSEIERLPEEEKKELVKKIIQKIE